LERLSYPGELGQIVCEIVQEVKNLEKGLPNKAQSDMIAKLALEFGVSVPRCDVLSSL
jgi:hypothetical protein